MSDTVIPEGFREIHISWAASLEDDAIRTMLIKLETLDQVLSLANRFDVLFTKYGDRRLMAIDGPGKKFKQR